MNDPQAISAIVAFFAPLVVSLVKQTGWPSSVNGIAAIAVYVVFGAGAVMAQGQTFTLDNIVPAVTIFTTVGTVAYTAFWKNTGLQTAITDSTSVVKGTGPTTTVTVTPPVYVDAATGDYVPAPPPPIAPTL